MKYKAPGNCPVCDHELVITRLSCEHCQSKLEGEFTSCKFCRLPAEQLEFVETFIKCRGNIKDVEKELGISYPTVKNRLESTLQALGYATSKFDYTEENEKRKQEILSELESGTITPKEAAEQLKKIRRG
jgi:hypothetical protein